MKASSSPNHLVVWLILAGLAFGGGGLWWLCGRDSSIPFLPEAGSAAWIVYPKPLDPKPRGALPLWAEFRRSFLVQTAPAGATLRARAFKQGTVRINGRVVDSLVLGDHDWKVRHKVDVSRFLHAGTNEISVTVSNSLGPPALWLSLKWETGAVHSDAEWHVSLVGAAWAKAVLASEPPAIRPGNHLYGREQIRSSLGRVWPALLGIGLVSALAVRVGGRYLQRAGAAVPSGNTGTNHAARAPLAMLGLIILSWMILFGNNLPQLAALFGFDRDGHQEYIDFILQKKALPLADDGWQMYQPPLFYLLSALIVGPFGWTASTDAGLLTLRAVCTVIGIAHLVLIFLCLRLMFPGEPRRQIVGLVLAGYLPAQVCLSHHVTNESLAALFVTATLYFCLRLFRTETRALGLALAVGVCLGLALLTKFSAVLAVPVIVAALVFRGFQGPESKVQGEAIGWLRRRWVGEVGLMLAACLAVCGWHFARVWERFGNPLIGNWDPRLPFAWWQDPGYRMGDWFWRIGEVMTTPLFSSVSGFADGIYCTLWGDGLCSGSISMKFRPQWNYDFMNAGYVLALLGTALLVLGLLVVVGRFVRQPTPEGLLMLGLIGAFAAGIGLMSLRVASYAQVKAFYALPALLPLCVIATAGWDFLARKGALIRGLLGAGLAAWAITVYAAFWVRSGDAYTFTARGLGLADDGRYAEAAENFSRALRLDTNSLPARIGLAESWRRLGRGEQARQQAALALQQHPDEAEAQIEQAVMLGLDQRYEEAARHLMQAVAKAPDHPTAYQQLAVCLAPLGAQKMVIAACRQGLRVDPFNPTLHQILATAATETGDPTNAVAHLRFALALRPKWPEARAALAVDLAAIGQPEEAVAQHEQAIREQPNDPRLRYLYALTLVSLGKALEAAEQYRRVLALQPDMIEVLNNLAWLLATNPDEVVRNGAEAIRLAEHACELSANKEPLFLGTLAAAYAEAGRFADAVKTAEKARDLAAAAGLKDIAARNSELLEFYRASKPYREPGGR